MTRCADSATVFKRYDMSSRDKIYSDLVSQHTKDLDQGYTDLAEGGDEVLSTIWDAFNNDYGVRQRIGKDVTGTEAVTMLEKLLLRPTKVLRPEKAEQLENQIDSMDDSAINDWTAHLVGLAKFGYVSESLANSGDVIRQRLKVSSVGSGGEDGLEKALEDLVAVVVSQSISHNVTLPQPDPDHMRSFEGRIRWCKECIDELVSGVAGSNEKAISDLAIGNSDQGEAKGSNSDKSKDELRTALNDLQFAHVYLTRQYEDEQSCYSRSVGELRLKLDQSQELLSATNNQLTKQTQQALKLETQLNQLRKDTSSKDKQLHDRQLEMNLLRVDRIGEEGDSQVSAPILRLEFKKLVQAMNEEFDQQLEKERVERKRLEDLVKIYESRGGVPAIDTSAGLRSGNTESVLTPPSSS